MKDPFLKQKPQRSFKGRQEQELDRIISEQNCICTHRGRNILRKPFIYYDLQTEINIFGVDGEHIPKHCF